MIFMLLFMWLNFMVVGWPDRGSKQRSPVVEASTLIITPPMLLLKLQIDRMVQNLSCIIQCIYIYCCCFSIFFRLMKHWMLKPYSETASLGWDRYVAIKIFLFILRKFHTLFTKSWYLKHDAMGDDHTTIIITYQKYTKKTYFSREYIY
jgi:hypothetical protein